MRQSDQPKTQPRQLTVREVERVAALLGRAFYHDPYSVWVYPDETRRAHCLALLYQITLRYALRYGEVTMAPDLTGVACWLPPERTSVSALRMLRIGALTTMLRMGLAGLWRLSAAEGAVQEAHLRCLAQPHWYLWVLGVDPMHHGQGIGGRLLRAGLAHADAAQLPCYLETMNPRNVPFYQRFGFALARDGTLPGSAVRLWGMVRPARPHV